MTGREAQITEEEARELWRRAVELQAAGGALAAWIGAASLAVVVAPAVVGGVVGAVGATVAFRKLYGSARGMGEMALRRLLHAVAVEAEGQP